ncbi:MAG: molybdopterin-dependent oxidoreductase [Cetobacterium sp.]
MSIKVNKKMYDFVEDTLLLDFLRSLDIAVPNLCHDDRLSHSDGECGICVVEVDGELQKACQTKLKDNVVIKTHSEKVLERRKKVLEKTIETHALDCLGCKKSGECKLQDYCYEYGVHQSVNSFKEELPLDNSNPFFTINPNKCIGCGKCAEVCKNLQGSSILEVKDYNGRKHVTPKEDSKINNTKCMSCGNCLSVCPVGALLPKEKESFRVWETKEVRTTCSYCGVGCQIDFSVKNNKIVDAKPANIVPNDGLLCVKGKFGYKFVDHPDRINTPLIRKNGKLEPATWEETYSLIGSKMLELKEKYGADTFGGLTSARCTNEDNYIFQKLFRAVIGTNNVDHCARL